MSIKKIISGVQPVKLGKSTINVILPVVAFFGVEVEGQVVVDKTELEATFKASGLKFEDFKKDFLGAANVGTGLDKKPQDFVVALQSALTEAHSILTGNVPTTDMQTLHNFNGLNTALGSLAVSQLGVPGSKVWDELAQNVANALVVEEPAQEQPTVETPEVTAEAEVPAEQPEPLPEAQEDPAEETTQEVEAAEETVESLPAEITAENLPAVNEAVKTIVQLNAVALQQNVAIGRATKATLDLLAGLSELQALNTQQLEAANAAYTTLLPQLQSLPATAETV